MTGRYESNHTAHTLVSGYSDRIVESLEILLALLETDLGLLMAACKASGRDDLVATAFNGKTNSGGGLMARAAENRAAAESVCLAWLERLGESEEGSGFRPDSGLESGSLVEDQREKDKGSLWREEEDEEYSWGYSQGTK